jgi:hypothetical protein
MNLGFVFSEEIRMLAKEKETCFRARLKFAWFPTKVYNESLTGNNLDKLQYVWLEYYSIIELYVLVEKKWYQNTVHPFIHPNDNLIEELHSDIFRYTDPKFFSYWDKRKKV